ncbi:hypothetical protein [Mycolicibacterium septicum]|uniref:hypothetical protein n=1 Tax=Mycolicibacterium septicum TaxID=98668 RepID=UPI002361CC73|nr:hypothetical protein [Mycolicibacterium septicum]
MNWGDLDRYPLLADVWGTAADWASGIGTFAAALIALVVYTATRRQERRAQASLVYVEQDGASVTVRNLSDKQIANVKIVPRIMSMWRATYAGEFDQVVMLGKPPVPQYPSYGFYEKSKQIQRDMRKNRAGLVVVPDKRVLKAGDETEDQAPGLLQGGMFYEVTFRDCRGLDWSIDVATRKLRRQKRECLRTLWCWAKSVVWSTWWAGKNETIYVWRRRLYHPAGRPPDGAE